MMMVSTDLDKPAEFDKALDGIERALEQEVRQIANDLLNPSHFDTAKILTAVGHIMQMSHRTMQFLPKLSTASAVHTEREGSLSDQEQQHWRRVTARVHDIRSWFIHWIHIEKMLRAQAPPKPRPLYAQVDEATVVQQAATDGVINALHSILNQSEQSEDAYKHGCFADVPLPNSIFMAHVHAARRVTLAMRLRQPPRFLDVGCGGGIKLISARQYFDYVDGLEYDPAYVAAAQQLLERSQVGRCNVFQADGLTFEGYGNYDIIYFFRPMRNDDILNDLERHITRSARPGTLIIAPYQIFESRYQQMNCAHLAGHLYVTGLSQEAADHLREKAELMGPDTGPMLPSPFAIWKPILEASHTRGYGI